MTTSDDTASATDSTIDAPTTSSETTGGPGPTTGCGFLCDTEPEGTIECDFLLQNCPEGEKCVAYDGISWGDLNSTKCVPVIGDGVAYEPCQLPMGPTGGVDTCAEGFMCTFYDPEAEEGVCYPTCAGTIEAPSCAEGSICRVFGVYALCLSVCDPLQQDCPGEDELCIANLATDDFVCVLDASEGVHPSGSPCEFANQCNSGNVCLNVDDYPHPDCVDAVGCCGPFCDVSNPTCPDAPPGLACRAWFEEGMAPDPYQDVGVCVIES